MIWTATAVMRSWSSSTRGCPTGSGARRPGNLPWRSGSGCSISPRSGRRTIRCGSMRRCCSKIPTRACARWLQPSRTRTICIAGSIITVPPSSRSLRPTGSTSTRSRVSIPTARSAPGWSCARRCGILPTNSSGPDRGTTTCGFSARSASERSRDGTTAGSGWSISRR